MSAPTFDEALQVAHDLGMCGHCGGVEQPRLCSFCSGARTPAEVSIQTAQWLVQLVLNHPGVLPVLREAVLKRYGVYLPKPAQRYPCWSCEGHGTVTLGPSGLTGQCPTCNGTGETQLSFRNPFRRDERSPREAEPCAQCDGLGGITLFRNGVQAVETCDVCRGRGWIPQ